MITKEQLKELIHYDENTGAFTWLPRCRSLFVSNGAFTMWHNRYCNKRAGFIDSDGYEKIKVFAKRYKSHQLAFLYMTGSIPKVCDHINRDRSDNRFCNLRPATRSQNGKNTSSRPNTTSKFLGVHYCSSKIIWFRSISINQKQKRLEFDNEYNAAVNYDNMARRHHKEFANLNLPCLAVDGVRYIQVKC